jgi:hypothetical protein
VMSANSSNFWYEMWSSLTGWQTSIWLASPTLINSLRVSRRRVSVGPWLLSIMAARARELRARALWGYGFKVLLTIDDWLLFIWPWPLLLVIGYGYWLLAMRIGHWLLAIGYSCWLLIFTQKNVAMVVTHFGYCPLSMAMF